MTFTPKKKKYCNGHKGLQLGHFGTPGAGGQVPSQKKNHISKNNWLQQQKERAERRKEKSAGSDGEVAGIHI